MPFVRATLALAASLLLPATAVPAVAAASATAAAAATSTASDDPGLVPGRTLSGVVEHDGAAATAAFGAWRGRPVEVVTDYLGGSTWASIANTTWARYRWQGTRYHVVWSMFMLPSDGSGSLAEGAKGAYDDVYRRAAEGLVAGGQGAATIRLGWELSGDWFRWAALRDPASDTAYWRHIVTAMRSVPGARFTFDWNISDQGVDPTRAYPGDAYVDLVGGDFYDQSWASSYAVTDHAAVWRHIVAMPYGLDWLAGFAKAHGKRVSLPEWALVQRCDGHGGGDDPVYIQGMHDWVATHDVAYETYFDERDDSCHAFELRGFPSAAARYKALWSGAATTPAPSAATPSAPPAPKPAVPPAPKPVVKPAPKPAPTGLRVSVRSDRRSARALSAARVRGRIYVFDLPKSAARQVVFRLDGRVVRRASGSPWDLVGQTGSRAKSYDTKRLRTGRHVLQATETLRSGGTRTVRATFTVAR